MRREHGNSNERQPSTLKNFLSRCQANEYLYSKASSSIDKNIEKIRKTSHKLI